MDGSAVNAIRDLVRPVTFEVNGVAFDAARVQPLPFPKAAALLCTTLASLRDYMQGNIDSLEPKKVVAHIMDPNTVVLRSSLAEVYRVREEYVLAKCQGGRFQFGQYIENEEFIVQLQALFEDKGDRAKILTVVGNMADEHVRTVADDGVTQTVNTKVGITQKSEMKVPNPVTLTPFRTFSDVKQPASKFVFRMSSGTRRGADEGTCALFEADNGAWRAEALANIRTWLLENLPKGVTVLS